jgi:hypothetical protein
MAYQYKRYGLIAQLLTANLNVTTDQAMAVNQAGTYIVDKIIITNVSTSLALGLAAGGFYTAASKGGTAIVGAGQVYTALTGATVFLNPTIAAGGTFTAQTLYFSLTTGNGSAATADILIFGFVLY